MVRELEAMLDISKSLVQNILSKKFKMRSVSSVWVPYLVMVEQLAKRVLVCHEWKEELRKDPNMLKMVVICDGIWTYHYDLCTKHESAVWKHTDSPPSKKVCHRKSVGKIVVVAFWDYCGVVYQHTVPSGTTITTAHYVNVLEYLWKHIAKKRLLPLTIYNYQRNMD